MITFVLMMYIKKHIAPLVQLWCD